MIEEPQIVKFSNECARSFCDKIAGAYLSAKSLLTMYEAKDIENNIIIETAGDITQYINDGAQTDGRSPISGSGVIAVQRIANWIVLNSEADENYTVNTVFRYAVNPRS